VNYVSVAVFLYCTHAFSVTGTVRNKWLRFLSRFLLSYCSKRIFLVLCYELLHWWSWIFFLILKVISISDTSFHRMYKLSLYFRHLFVSQVKNRDKFEDYTIVQYRRTNDTLLVFTLLPLTGRYLKWKLNFCLLWNSERFCFGMSLKWDFFTAVLILMRSSYLLAHSLVTGSSFPIWVL
jgi:hypothetical protein